MKGYSYLDRVLHEQFLGNTILSQALYQRLLRNGNSCQYPSTSHHVFISGLARSGTTALLNQLYSTNVYASICYYHMPFILSPTVAAYSARFSPNGIPRERFHKDGITISLNSPECLDEPFWIKSDPQYFSRPLDCETVYGISALRAYDFLLCQFARKQKKKASLVKNNNNHVRLHQLTDHFPHSLFLCIFRHPIAHSISLWRTHHVFLNQYSVQPYASEYMRLLGHREFGRYQQPFIYGSTSPFKLCDGNPQDPNYWLEQWINTHSWYLDSRLTETHNIIWLCQESLCTQTALLNKLFDLLRLDHVDRILNLETAYSIPTDDRLDVKKLALALEIYKELASHSLI